MNECEEEKQQAAVEILVSRQIGSRKTTLHQDTVKNMPF
jgi:hypothetical protein